MEENYAYPDSRRRVRNCPGTEGFAGKKQVLQDSLRENIQTVILKHFWDDKYKDIKVSPRNLRQSPSFCIPKSPTKLGTCLSSFYVPTIFNDF